MKHFDYFAVTTVTSDVASSRLITVTGFTTEVAIRIAATAM
jgi:hypothetical protein